MWLNQNFLLPDEIESRDGDLDIMFLSLRTGNPLAIKMDQSGNVRSAIIHFTVVCSVAKSSNRSGAKGDLVMIQTLLLFKCKSLFKFEAQPG